MADPIRSSILPFFCFCIVIFYGNFLLCKKISIYTFFNVSNLIYMASNLSWIYFIQKVTMRGVFLWKEKYWWIYILVFAQYDWFTGWWGLFYSIGSKMLIYQYNQADDNGMHFDKHLHLLACFHTYNWSFPHVPLIDVLTCVFPWEVLVVWFLYKVSHHWSSNK